MNTCVGVDLNKRGSIIITLYGQTTTIQFDRWMHKRNVRIRRINGYATIESAFIEV